MRNPKLLGLIRKGCSITFPSGVIFHRIPNSVFMESTSPTDGDYVYDLSEQGLEDALDYEDTFTALLEDDEKLETEEREEEM